MVRVDIWGPIDQDSGQGRRDEGWPWFIPSTRGGRRYKYAAATLESVGAWSGQGGGQGLLWTRGMAVLAVPPPGQVMLGARGQGAGGQGAGCAQVGRGGASRPASQSAARCGWPDTPDSQSEEGGKYIFSCEYISREQVARSHK